MPSSTFEDLRNYYKPDVIEVLFVGESRPQGGTFFYKGDSNLFRETKKAFDGYFGENIFTLEAFKRWNCWLYDICEDHVNGMDDKGREDEVIRNLPRLENCIKSENPKYIVVCKKGAVIKAICTSSIMNKYSENETIFFLPYPNYGRQKEYRTRLVKVLTMISFKRTR